MLALLFPLYKSGLTIKWPNLCLIVCLQLLTDNNELPVDEVFNSTELDDDQLHFQYFDKIKGLCQEVAETSYGAQLHRQRITIVNAGSTAVYGKKYGVLLTPQLMFSSVLTHEMVHSFYIGHSYSDRKIRVAFHCSFKSIKTLFRSFPMLYLESMMIGRSLWIKHLLNTYFLVTIWCQLQTHTCIELTLEW